MARKGNSLYERIELPDISGLQENDIPPQAGNLSKTERTQTLRTRKNAEQVVRSVIRAVDENKSAFQQVDNFEAASLPTLLDRRLKLQPIREKLEEALTVITDAELITNNQIQRVLLRVNEVVGALETLNPGIARDFEPLREYVKTNDGKKRKTNTDE